MRVHIGVPMKIKRGTCIFNYIESSFVRGWEIKITAEQLPANKAIIIQNVHKTLDTFSMLESSKTGLGQSKRFTIVVKVPPN